jgi:hypothetical protein
MAQVLNRKHLSQFAAPFTRLRVGLGKFLLAGVIFFLVAAARAQTTAFTFQGRLNDSGTPANGTYDMQFELFQTPGLGTGSQIGATITLPGVKVTSGVFTVQLDFTAPAFSGGDRFVEVGVTPAGSGAPFTTLDPRQPITPTPYALFSYSAYTATTATMATGPFNIGGSNGSLYIGLSGVGTPPVYGTSAGIAIDAETRSGGEAIYAECLQAGNNCYALEGYAPTGDYAGYMYGGKGVYVESDDAAQSGLDASAYGSNAYAVHGESASYRAGYFKSDSNANYSLYVDSKDGPTQSTAALNVRGTIRGEGNLIIGGSKAGYVVDIMQNVDNEALVPGDVVVIVGNSAPVLGQIPVITVKKASGANDIGLAGVVDEVWSAPDAATKTAYEAQEEVVRTAKPARAMARTETGPKRPKAVDVPLPLSNITDEQGTLHTLPLAASAGTGGYVSVVTLGAYKMVKVDATQGAIQTGDLLTTSSNPGYAMKAAPVVVNGIDIYRTGTILGKALEPLDKGTGVIKVFVTLR